MASIRVSSALLLSSFWHEVNPINAGLEGSYLKLLMAIEKADLLILDDFGLAAFDNQSRQVLMDIIESKYDKTSVVVSSQIPVASWHELIGEGTVADAILDRIVHSSHQIQLKGESLRKNKLKWSWNKNKNMWVFQKLKCKKSKQINV